MKLMRITLSNKRPKAILSGAACGVFVMLLTSAIGYLLNQWSGGMAPQYQWIGLSLGIWTGCDGYDLSMKLQGKARDASFEK